MKNSDFNFNIKIYTVKELEEVLELPNNYDETIIIGQEVKLRQNIINNKDIPSNVKIEMLNFINKTKNKLIEYSKNKLSYANTNNNNNNNNNNDTKSELVENNDKNIITHPTTPYSQSFPSEFYQGTINPLNKRILRQNINIDTRFRENYYGSMSSNFHLDLPLKLSQVVSLQLTALELPNTLYVISQVFGNNFFVLEIPGEAPFIVKLSDGNYDYLALQDYINNVLSTAPGSYSDIQFLSDANTPGGSGPTGGSGRMVVGLKAGSLITEFAINFLTDINGNEDRQTPLPLKIGWLMGFRLGYYTNNVTYVSEGIINLLGPKYIYLVVDDFNNNVLDGYYAAFTSSILNKNILARISLQDSVFNYLSKDNYNLISSPRQYFGPVDIQKLQIQLLDEYGRVLNLNNMDYSFCLTFQTVYNL
jgi:hypothetical protein